MVREHLKKYQRLIKMLAILTTAMLAGAAATRLIDMWSYGTLMSMDALSMGFLLLTGLFWAVMFLKQDLKA